MYLLQHDVVRMHQACESSFIHQTTAKLVNLTLKQNSLAL